MKPRFFRQLPECNSCQFFSLSPLLPCTVHPHGVEGDRCIDYRLDPDYDENDPMLTWFTGDFIEDLDYRNPFDPTDF